MVRRSVLADWVWLPCCIAGVPQIIHPSTPPRCHPGQAALSRCAVSIFAGCWLKQAVPPASVSASLTGCGWDSLACRSLQTPKLGCPINTSTVAVQSAV